MLLNKNQKNPIIYKNRSITIKEEYLNAMHIFCTTPVGEDYISEYIDEGQLNDEEIAMRVEDDIKNEICSLSSPDVWESVFASAKEQG